MRILHVGKYFPPFHGGMEYFVRDLAHAQAQAGHQVAVVVHHQRFGARLEREEQAVRAPEAGGRIQIIRIPSYGRLLFAPISPGFGWQLAREIRRFAPQLLHIHLPNTSAFQLLALPLARRLPWVIHWHSDVLTPQSSTAMGLAYRLYRPAEQAMLKRAKRIIVTSPPYLETSAALRQHRAACRQIPLGIDEERVLAGQQPTPSGPHLEHGPLRLLAVGRLTYYKGFDQLLHALEGLESVHLTLVGTGTQRKQLLGLIHTLGLSHRVRLLQGLSQAQLAAEMAACHCLCLPSVERTEAFGMVLLEAMAQARATIATKVAGSGMAWVVREGETGLLAAPGDPHSLAACITRLNDNRPLAHALGQGGRQVFQAEFRIERVATKITHVYNECMQP